MKIIIKTKNIELSPSIENFVEEKIGSLKKFIKIFQREDSDKGKPLAEVFVELEKETKHHRKGELFKAEVIIALPRKKIVAEAKGDDLWGAIVEVKDNLQQEIKKYKVKSIDSSIRERRKNKREVIG